MSVQPIQLYTSQPPSYQVVAALNKVSSACGQPFELLPLEQLPPPDLNHSQQRKAELVGLRAQLSSCLDFIILAESNRRFTDQLPELRRERDSLEFYIEQLEHQLSKQVPAGQEGGSQHE